jgi:hypothetical protein
MVLILIGCCMPQCSLIGTKAAMGQWRPPWLKSVSGANFFSVLYVGLCVDTIAGVAENRLNSNVDINDNVF